MMRVRKYDVLFILVGCTVLLNVYLLSNSDKACQLPVSLLSEQKHENNSSTGKNKLISIMNERRDTLRNYCLKNSKYKSDKRKIELNNMTKEFLIYNEKTRSLLCFAPKVGTSFWVRVIFYLRHKSRYTSPYVIPVEVARGNVKRFRDIRLTENEMENFFHDSKKFIITRDPFDRLYSFYLSKLFTPNQSYMSIVGRYIIHDHRKNASLSSLKCGNDVTFTEVLRYVIALEKRKQVPDEHLERLNNICSTCEVDYDFIGKTSSFSQDGVYILRELGYNQSEIDELLNLKYMDRFQREFTSFFRQSHTVYTSACLSLTARIERFWTKMKITGVFSATENVPSFSKPNPDVLDIYSSAWEAFYRSESDITRKRNKEIAMLREYGKQDRDLVLELERVLAPDLEAFGYSRISDRLSKLNT